MTAEVTAGAAVIVGALLLILLERRRPYDPRQKLFRRELLGDLVFYGLAQSYVLGFAITAFVHLVATRATQAGLPRGLFHDWPVALQVAFFVVTHDFYIYWFHRAQHASPRLWRLHEAHHSPRDVDWISGARSHAFEIAINQTVELAPIVLLGAHPWVIPIKLVISVLTGMYIHSNIDVHHPRWLWFLNGPALHRWHHAVETADHNVNFATKLALWDRCFGTASTPPGKPRAYGLADPSFPTTYWRQQLHPFSRHRQSPANQPSP